MRRAVLVCLLAACDVPVTDFTPSVSLTVEPRPAVHGVTRLRVTTASGVSTQTEEFAATDLPVTLDLLASRPELPVTITVDGFDGSDLEVGAGTTTLVTDTSTATVVLEPDDFVVNTTYAGNQFVSNDFEAGGVQLAADATSSWTVGFSDECTTCNVFARRFDATGQSAAGMLTVSTTLTTSGATPAVTTAGSTTFVLWDFADPVGTAKGVACRTFSADGVPMAAQQTISSEAADVVSATGLSNGNAAVTWQVFQSAKVVRLAIVQPDCTLVGSVQTVSVSAASTGTAGASRSHVAANGSTLLVSWITDNNLWVRTSSLAGALGSEIKLVNATTTQTIEHARVAPLGTGFIIATRWASTMTSGLGKFEVYRVSSVGVLSSLTLISDRVHSDFSSTKAFGVASRASDGALLIAWHDCEAAAGTCDVSGQLVHPLGMLVGPPRALATNLAADQVNPSVAALSDAFVAAWTDSSGTAPDASGTAVRARILYPDPDEATSVRGARCGGSLPPCDADLVCAASSDALERCFATCTSVCLDGGRCVSGACIY